MEPLSIITPPVRKSLFAGVSLSLGVLAWSVWAEIPIEVSGTGVLSPIRGISRIYSPSSGSISWHLNNKNNKWQYDAAKFVVSPNNFDTEQLVKLAKAIFDDKHHITSLSDETHEDINSSYEGVFVDDNKLLAWVRDNIRYEKFNNAYIKSMSILEYSRKETVFTKSKLESLEIELKIQSSYLFDMKELRAEGYVSATRIYDQVSKVDSLKANILDEKNNLLNIKAKEISAVSNLRIALSEMINNSMIFSQGENFILKLVPNERARVKPRDLMLLYSKTKIRQPRFVPIYVSNKDSASIKPGMEAFVVPKGYSQTSDGAIQAIVHSIDTLPSELSQIQYSIGSSTESQTILNDYPSPTLLILELLRTKNNSKLNSNGSGYKWITKNTKSYPPKIGQFLNVKIITRYKRPIEFLLPNILKFFGFSQPL